MPEGTPRKVPDSIPGDCGGFSVWGCTVAKEGLTTRPWYRWSPRDFLAHPAVVAMEREQRWRYREALDFSWLSETPGIATEDQWRKWLGYNLEQWSTAREAFICAFEVNEPHWIQKRLADEHAHATLKSNSARLSGLARQSANAERPVSERSANAQRTLVDAHPTLADAVESKKNQSKREPEKLTLSSPAATRVSEPATFPAFWAAYPRRVGRKAAVAAYQRALKGGADSESILAAVVAQRASSAWTKDGGQFIPHPTTWLNQGRWADDVQNQGTPRSQSDAEYAALNRIGE